MSADAVPSCGWFLPNEPFTSNEDDQIFAAYSERKRITHVLLAKGKELVDFGNFIDLVTRSRIREVSDIPLQFRALFLAFCRINDLISSNSDECDQDEGEIAEPGDDDNTAEQGRELAWIAELLVFPSMWSGEHRDNSRVLFRRYVEQFGSPQLQRKIRLQDPPSFENILCNSLLNKRSSSSPFLALRRQAKSILDMFLTHLRRTTSNSDSNNGVGYDPITHFDDDDMVIIERPEVAATNIAGEEPGNLPMNLPFKCRFDEDDQVVVRRETGWFHAIVKFSKVIARTSLGEVFSYHVVFSDGSEDRDVQECYVVGQEDFFLFRRYHSFPGFRHLKAKPESDDSYAKMLGWFETDETGDRKFGSFGNAMRSRDDAVVAKLQADTGVSDLFFANEWQCFEAKQTPKRKEETLHEHSTDEIGIQHADGTQQRSVGIGECDDVLIDTFVDSQMKAKDFENNRHYKRKTTGLQAYTNKMKKHKKEYLEKLEAT